jgi:hypothetical protein
MDSDITASGHDVLGAELPPGFEDGASWLGFGGAEGLLDGIEATGIDPSVPEGVNGIGD